MEALERLAAPSLVAVPLVKLPAARALHLRQLVNEVRSIIPRPLPLVEETHFRRLYQEGRFEDLLKVVWGILPSQVQLVLLTTTLEERTDWGYVIFPRFSDPVFNEPRFVVRLYEDWLRELSYDETVATFSSFVAEVLLKTTAHPFDGNKEAVVAAAMMLGFRDIWCRAATHLRFLSMSREDIEYVASLIRSP